VDGLGAMNYEKLVEEVVAEYRAAPIDILGIGDAQGEATYLDNLRDSYVRTIRDVDGLFDGGRGGRRILEIGSFLGAASIALKRMGFEVSAVDIPEFHKSPALRALYERNGIPYAGLNLRKSRLPQESGSMDAVVICEVIEHFNFNPLPVLLEINRVLKPGGYVYIGMPNQASLQKRIALLHGQSIHNPIDDFFKQLDPKDNMIVGLHWREYTMGETLEMLRRTGFEAAKQYYFQPREQPKPGLWQALQRRLVAWRPAFRAFQVVVGRKLSTPSYDFWRTEANS
jgi:SAM-dependent methyltransferase